MSGGAGIDSLYFLDVYADNVSFGVPQDGVSSRNTQGVSCDLEILTGQDFGIFGVDEIVGFENLHGGDGGDRFWGTDGVNRIEGWNGSDTLSGRGGNDTLYGGDQGDIVAGNGQNDDLYGGTGADTLDGGAGADFMTLGNISNGADGARDIVRYFNISNSGITDGTRDSIQFFDATNSSANSDKIDLSDIDARAGTTANDTFIFRGAGAFTSADGEVRVVQMAGYVRVEVDNDADADAEMSFDVDIKGATTLNAGDFIL